MKFVTGIFYKKSFWFLFLLGLNLATGQMPFDLPFSAFVSLIVLGAAWVKYEPLGLDAFIWGLGFGFGYFGLTFFWIVEPFLIEPSKTGWLAPFALIGLIVSLSLILSMSFFLASQLGKGRGKNQRIIILFVFFTLSELIRSDFLLNFPWGLISSIWINTPASQALSLFGPYWLSAITILSAFLLSSLWLRSIIGVMLLFFLFSFGHDRLNQPLYDRLDEVKFRVIQPNIKQADKWKPEFAATFLNKQIELSRDARKNGVDVIIWPEMAISYEIQKENKLRELILNKLDVDLVLGARRFDDEKNKLFNSAFLLASNGNIVEVYDKIKLVPFGEYIPFGEFFSSFDKFGLANAGPIGFSRGDHNGIFETSNLGVFKILICYEAIFTGAFTKNEQRPSWLVHITNDAWFGKFSGPHQHLTLARMRAIEQGLPLVRAANTGISALIGPYGRVHSELSLGRTAFLEDALPAALEPTLYLKLGAKFCKILLIFVLMLTILALISIYRVERVRHND